jgi:hypothetical protein
VSWGALLIAVFLALGLSRRRSGLGAQLAVLIAVVVTLAVVFTRLGRL